MPLFKKQTEQEKSESNHAKECKSDYKKLAKIQKDIEKKNKRIGKIEQMMSVDLPKEKEDLMKAIQMDSDRFNKGNDVFNGSCGDVKLSKKEKEDIEEEPEGKSE